MCSPTSSGRHVQEVLRVADGALGQLDAEQHRRCTLDRRKGQRAAQDERTDRQADEHHHQVGVQLGQPGDRQVDAVHPCRS